MNLKFDEPRKKEFVKARKEGYSITSACKLVNISIQTYYNHYNEDSDQHDAEFHQKVNNAEAKAVGKVENALYEEAVDGNIGAIKIFLTNQVSEEWQDKQRHELSGPNGKPIKTEEEINFDEGQTEAFLDAVETNREREGDSQEGSE